MPIKIFVEKCKKNHNCSTASCPAADSCPIGALVKKDVKNAPVIDATKCIECELCTTTCPNNVFVREE